MNVVVGGYRSPKHRDEHARSVRSVLLAVDQKLGEGATLRVAPELAGPLGPARSTPCAKCYQQDDESGGAP
jgi:hypothetical protein